MTLSCCGVYHTALLGGEVWLGFLQGQVSVRNVPFITAVLSVQ